MIDYLPKLNVSPEVEAAFIDKKIYYTFAYAGELRFYKHNQLVWYAVASHSINHYGRLILNAGWLDELVKKGNECIDFFIKNGYIPNMESNE